MTEGPAPWIAVQLEEFEALHGSLDPAARERFHAAASTSSDAARETLAALNQRAFAAGSSALCLSGGGVRSASFSIGVLQVLARLGVLRQFDYLSTVSGGGFAGSWLSAWIHRAADDENARRELAHFEHGQRTGEVEPAPLAQLRRFIRYMSPKEGAFSADAWTLGATMMRNLIVNWLVILPLLTGALLLPRVHLALIHVADRGYTAGMRFSFGELETWILLAAGALLTAVFAYAAADLPSYGNRRRSQRDFLRQCLLPLVVATLALTYFWASDRIVLTLSGMLIACCVGHAIVWAVAALLMGRRGFHPWTALAGAASAVIPAAGLWWMTQAVFPNGVPLEQLYVALAFPMILGLLLLGGFVFVGLAGEDFEAGDLEWWSRFAAWVAIAATVWLAGSAVVFGGPRLFEITREAVADGLNLRSTHAGILTGLVTPLLGALVARLSRADGSRGSGVVRRVLLATAAPAFAAAVLSTISWASNYAIGRVARTALVSRLAIDARAMELIAVLLVGAALVTAGVLASRVVPVNKFSLSGMYRHRLVRAFLGASRGRRSPNPFTGFDPADDLPLADLASVRPLHVINATLNMVAQRELGQQERKAEPFTFSPLRVGAAALGYRPTTEYGADPVSGEGVSLGTAVAISGAAASPSMGMYSQPATTFLMALLNARLGAWMGNPGPAGAATWRNAEPGTGPLLMLDELVGNTTASHPYVYLSDGGHFDNLGLLEMVRRRCRFIVVVDGGADPTYTYADLANAVRRIRIDLGVRIEMDRMDITAARQGDGNPHCLVGSIHYDAVDGGQAVGTLVYIKPALSGDEPSDVRNYAASHPLFPHESTVNQWFGEAQFESYRMLGMHSAEAITGGRLACEEVTPLSVAGLCAAALAYRQGSPSSRVPGSGV
jgi:hypothetical protein